MISTLSEASPEMHETILHRRSRSLGLVGRGAAWGAANLLNVLDGSYHWTLLGLAGQPEYWTRRRPCIFMFWHSRQLLMPFLYRRMTGGRDGVISLISRHRDGRMISETVRRLGFGSVAGSSTRGGTRAVLEIVDLLRSGKQVAITPDGPRGPASRLKMGVVLLASKCSVPVFPVALGSNRAWRFGSWDSMLLPKPFARVVAVVGEPLTVESDLSRHAWPEVAALFESRLNNLTQMVDGYYA